MAPPSSTISSDRIAAYIEYGHLAVARGHQDLAAARGRRGLLFVVEPDSLTALKQETGALAWRLPFNDAIAVAPVWDIGWLIVSTNAGHVLAFRATDGVLIWRKDLGTPLHARPSLAADRVYLPTGDGKIVALKVDTGDVVWERETGRAAERDTCPRQTALRRLRTTTTCIASTPRRA